MSDDGMRLRQDQWISASRIAEFVYCERKYRLSADPPPGHVEPAAIAGRKASGTVYHRRKGIMLGARLFLQKVLLLAGILLCAGAGAIWLFH